MNNDPPIDAIRKVRHEISAAVDHDPRKLVEYYQRLQEQYADRIIRRKPGRDMLDGQSPGDEKP